MLTCQELLAFQHLIAGKLALYAYLTLKKKLNFLILLMSIERPTFRNHRQWIGDQLESINGRGYCLTDKINPNQLFILIKAGPRSAIGRAPDS